MPPSSWRCSFFAPATRATLTEDHGLTPATLGACDAVAFVPLLGRVGSLNVATAAAIALYELRRKGWTG